MVDPESQYAPSKENEWQLLMKQTRSGDSSGPQTKFSKQLNLPMVKPGWVQLGGKYAGKTLCYSNQVKPQEPGNVVPVK